MFILKRETNKTTRYISPPLSFIFALSRFHVYIFSQQEELLPLELPRPGWASLSTPLLHGECSGKRQVKARLLAGVKLHSPTTLVCLWLIVGQLQQLWSWLQTTASSADTIYRWVEEIFFFLKFVFQKLEITNVVQFSSQCFERWRSD